MKQIVPVAVACFVSSLGLASAHGGLTIPVPRNNFGMVWPGNWTPISSYYPGGPCAGDACLWFNEGCWTGCKLCSNEMPAGQFGNYYGMPFGSNRTADCVLTGPTLPEVSGFQMKMGPSKHHHLWPFIDFHTLMNTLSGLLQQH